MRRPQLHKASDKHCLQALVVARDINGKTALVSPMSANPFPPFHARPVRPALACSTMVHGA